MSKRQPIGICDHCEGEIPPGDWYTSKGRPRQYCCRECRNTANSRQGAPQRAAQVRQAIAEGRWRNPLQVRPPTSAEQAARARAGRLREVAEGRWHNPALDPAARAKLSRPRVHAGAPLLHSAIERLRQGAQLADLAPEQIECYRAYRRALRQARQTTLQEERP